MTMPTEGAVSEANTQELTDTYPSPTKYQIKRDESFAAFFIGAFNDLSSSQRHVSTYIPLDPFVPKNEDQEKEDQIVKYLSAPHYIRNQMKHPVTKIIDVFLDNRNDLFKNIVVSLFNTSTPNKLNFNQEGEVAEILANTQLSIEPGEASLNPLADEEKGYFWEITSELNAAQDRVSQIDIVITILKEKTNDLFRGNDQSITTLNKKITTIGQSLKENSLGSSEEIYMKLVEVNDLISSLMAELNNKERRNKLWEVASMIVAEEMQSYNAGGQYPATNSLGSKDVKIEQQEREDNNITRRTIKKEVSNPQRKLEDEIIEHARQGVEYLVNKLSRVFPSHTNDNPIIVADNQLKAKYPCLVIRLNDAYEHHKQMAKIHNHYDKAYPEFLTHLMIAYINKELYDKEIGVYFDRRQSFGFLTPTATDVGTGIRLNLGLIPSKEWLDCVITGIQTFSTNLHTLWENKVITYGKKARNKKGKMGDPQAKFNSGNIQGYGHHLFLHGLITDTTNDSIAAIKNIIIQINTDQFNAENKPAASGKILELRGKLEKKYKDSVDTNDTYTAKFMELYNAIKSIYPDPENAKSSANNAPSSARDKMQILQRNIDEYINRSINDARKLTEIEVTSESEGEVKTPQNLPEASNVAAASSSNTIPAQVPAKLTKNRRKYLSSAGMSALFIPLLAYRNAFQSGEENIRYATAPYCYFELDGWKGKFSAEAKIEHVNYHVDKDKAKEPLNREEPKLLDNDEMLPKRQKTDHEPVYPTPHIIFFDNNPCVNGVEQPLTAKDIFSPYTRLPNQEPKTGVQMIVADVTCATQQEKKHIIELWGKTNIPFLVFAESGLKYRQFGLDTALYGENMLYINDKYVDQANADKLKKYFNYYTQGESTVYATQIRRELRVRTQAWMRTRLRKKKANEEPVSSSRSDPSSSAEEDGGYSGDIDEDNIPNSLSGLSPGS